MSETPAIYKSGNLCFLPRSKVFLIKPVKPELKPVKPEYGIKCDTSESIQFKAKVVIFKNPVKP